MRMMFSLMVLALLYSGTAFASEGFDCAQTCFQLGKNALEECKALHAKDPGFCPADDGRMLEDCKKVCAELSGLSPEELLKKLAPDFKGGSQGL